jgi:hypothetical protein
MTKEETNINLKKLLESMPEKTIGEIMLYMQMAESQVRKKVNIARHVQDIVNKENNAK